MSARRCVSPCKIKAGNASQAMFLDDIVFGFFFLKKQSKSKGLSLAELPGWVSRKVVTGGVLEGSETTPLLNKNLRGLLVILSSRWWARVVERSKVNGNKQFRHPPK